MSIRRIAQVCCAVAGAATVLPWHTGTGLSGTGVVRGIGTLQGRLLAVVCIAAIVLTQVGWRPAWIAAGFAAAISLREVFAPSGVGDIGAGSGLWIAAAAAVGAAVLLLWDLCVSVSARGDGGDSDEPPRRGLSGPLGRRQ